MIGIFRKHMKVILWVIILMIVPAFVFWGTGEVRKNRGKAGNQPFGTAHDEVIKRMEYEIAQGNEARMTRHFHDQILRGMKYREPEHQYWQVFRKILAERALNWEHRRHPRTYLLQYAVYMGFAQPFPPGYDSDAEAHLKNVMFPLIEDGRFTGELDEEKYKAYMKKHGLAKEELLEEARDNFRINRYLRILLSSEDPRMSKIFRSQVNKIFRSQVWERMLLLREVKKWGIQVTREEIREYLVILLGGPSEDLKTTYRCYLEARNISEKHLKTEISDNIKLLKLRTMIADTTVVPNYDVRELFDIENVEKKVAYKRISTGEMGSAFDATPEVSQYYFAHQEELQDPRRVMVDYIVLGTDSFSSLVQISEEEVKEEYDANPEKYKDEDGEPQEFADVAYEIKKELRGGKSKVLAEKKGKLIFDFSDAAEMKSIAEQNGLEVKHSGMISEDASDVDGAEDIGEFIRIALATELGKISPVIDVGNGFAILSPTEIHEPGQSTPASAAKRISAKLAENEAQDFLSQVRVKIPAKAQARYIVLPFEEGRKKLEVKTVEEFEKLPGLFDPELQMNTSNYVTKFEEVDDLIKDNPQFKSAMFKIEVGEISRPLFSVNGMIVLTPIQKRPEKLINPKELAELAAKENPTEEEKALLDEAEFNKEEYEQFVDTLADVLNDGLLGMSKQELYMNYDYARRKDLMGEDIKVTPRRMVTYLCIETENIKDYLNKPFYFEVEEYYDENSDKFYDEATGKPRPFVKMKEEIEKELSEKREKDFEEAVKSYYRKHKDDFSRSVDGKKTVPSLDEIRDEVVKKTQEQELFKLSLKRAEQLPIAKATQLRDQARKHGLVIHESNLFSPNDESRIDSFLTGSEELFRDYAFMTPLGEVSVRPVRTEKGYCILSPGMAVPYSTGDEETGEDTTGQFLGFEDAIPVLEENIKTLFASSTSGNVARYISSILAKKIEKENMDFAGATEETGFRFEETEYFKLMDKSLEGFENAEELIPRMSVRLQQRDPKTSAPVELLYMEADTMLFRLVDEKKPTEKEYHAGISEYRERLIQEKMAKTYEEWLRSLGKLANIEPTLEKLDDEQRKKQEPATGEQPG